MIEFSANNLRKFGEKLVTKIHERTLRGLDKDFKPFKAYSKNPFALPLMAITKRARAILIKNGNISFFKKGKIRYAVVDNYLTLKKAIYAKTDYDGKVNLTLSGAMLGSMTVTKTGTNYIQIGFTRSEMAKRALYNIAKGRDFFGVSNADVDSNDLKVLI